VVRAERSSELPATTQPNLRRAEAIKRYFLGLRFRKRLADNFLDRIEHLSDRIRIHHGDLTDLASLIHLLELVRPDEVYNLAAQSFVPTSWQQPVSMPLELTEAGVQARLGLVADPHVHLDATAAGGCP